MLFVDYKQWRSVLYSGVVSRVRVCRVRKDIVTMVREKFGKVGQ